MADLPRLMTLQEAADKLGGGITARALRTEARNGRLHLTRVAGKYYVTESDLAGMLTSCRDAQKAPGSGCTNETTASRPGSSSMPDASMAQTAARATALALKE
ncbi:unnamed protein product, partial [Phaeothamnion confervicola]